MEGGNPTEEEGTMMRALRVTALFAAYSAVGYGGDYAVGLLAQEAQARIETDVVEVRRTVVVEVRPTVVSRVLVRHGAACSYESERDFSLPADASGSLSLRAGSGELHVEGREGLEGIVVVGLLCASHEEYLQDLDISIERESGGDVAIQTVYPDQRDHSDGRNVARIDLTVLVPRGMAVDIDDSSGGIEVFGTGDLSVDDSSGDLRVHDIDGSLIIDDSSGSLDVENVSGDVEIEDGSGGVDVRMVGGSLHLRDGSGGIQATDIDGDVVVESDGSGGIEVRDVGGDFIVDRDGSGGIRHSGVEGRVEVPRKRR
jgi:hypothetical protein